MLASSACASLSRFIASWNTKEETTMEEQRILNINVGILGHIDSGKTCLGWYPSNRTSKLMLES